MRVIFAYDGSSCADAALRDLQYAGLPADTECIVLTVADVWPPAEDAEDDGHLILSLDPIVQERMLAMRETARSKIADAAVTADRAAKSIQSMFSGWKVSPEAVAGSPGWGIVTKAESCSADLIIVGAHGMSAAARILVGSVSRQVMRHAPCSVRIARSQTKLDRTPLRLVIGFDGSSDAQNAVRTVAGRVWPPETQVKLVTAIDDTMRTAIAARILKLDERVRLRRTDDEHHWLATMSETAAEELRHAGLEATCSAIEGDPKRVLLNAARECQAEALFLGATGLRGLRRLLLGSVSNAVATAAECTVEIVREK